MQGAMGVYLTIEEVRVRFRSSCGMASLSFGCLGYGWKAKVGEVSRSLMLIMSE